jgi:peptidoglycan/LPS O-acetylase OafA/YrhL
MGILRFLLALSVVLAHSNSSYSLIGGPLAVQAFYIISGFYMSLILNEKYVGSNKSFKLFFSNRILRLYPIYWMVLLLTVISSISLGFYTNWDKAGRIDIYIEYYHKMEMGSFIFLIFTNIFIFFQDAVMFLGLDPSTGNVFFTKNYATTQPFLYEFLLIPQAWTLGIELAFYLIAPFIVRRRTIVFICLILFSLGLRLYLYNFLNLKQDPWSYRFFPTELVFFILGALAYRIYRKIRVKQNIKKPFLLTCWLVLICFIFLFTQSSFEYKGPVFLFVFFLILPLVFQLTKNWKLDSYIGELSYPMYISHILVLSVLNVINIPFFGKGSMIAGIIATVLFSVLLNELIAKRIEKIRQGRLTKAKNPQQ